MKGRSVVLAVVWVLTAGLLTGCEKTAEQNLDRAKADAAGIKQELNDTRAEYLAEWQTFKRESERTIAANEKRIDAFKAKIERAGTKVKAKYNKDIAALEQKNRGLTMTLEEYHDGGRTKWEEFKTNFQRDMDDIGTTMKDVFKDNE